nr:hypothetical protein GCM10017583_09880 [Agromyces mediolanus]
MGEEVAGGVVVDGADTVEFGRHVPGARGAAGGVGEGEGGDGDEDLGAYGGGGSVAGEPVGGGVGAELVEGAGLVWLA